MRMPSSRTSAYLLIAILVVAAILRFNRITQPFIDVFSWRQTSTAMMAENFYRTNGNIFYPQVNWDGPGPSYQGREFQTVSYIVALLYHVLGQHDWIGRTIAAIFGLWGIFALYQLVYHLWDEERALATIAVMAVLPGSIFIERSFLPDPAMVALIITSFWLLVVYLQTKRVLYLILAGIIGSWACLTKIPALITTIPMLYTVLAILTSRRALRPAILVQLGGVAVIALLPVIAYYLWARHLSHSYPPYHFAGSGNWIWSVGLQRWLNQQFYIPKMLQEGIPFVWLWTIPGITMAALGFLFHPPQSTVSHETRQTVNKVGQAPWLFHWWLAACGLYYLIGALELIENPWNFHIFTPPVAAFIAHAIVTINTAVAARNRWSSASLLRTAVILLLIAALGQRTLRPFYRGPYGDESYRLGLALSTVSQPDDLVVTIASDLGNPNAIYYSGRRGWVFPPARPNSEWNKLPEDDGEAIQMFEEVRSGGAEWLGIAQKHVDNLRQKHSALMAHIEQTCELRSSDTYGLIYQILPSEERAKLSTRR